MNRPFGGISTQIGHFLPEKMKPMRNSRGSMNENDGATGGAKRMFWINLMEGNELVVVGRLLSIGPQRKMAIHHWARPKKEANLGHWRWTPPDSAQIGCQRKRGEQGHEKVARAAKTDPWPWAHCSFFLPLFSERFLFAMKWMAPPRRRWTSQLGAVLSATRTASRPP